MLHHLIEILDIPLLSSSRENENKFMMCTRILSFSNIGCFFTTSKKKKKKRSSYWRRCLICKNFNRSTDFLHLLTFWCCFKSREFFQDRKKIFDSGGEISRGWPSHIPKEMMILQVFSYSINVRNDIYLQNGGKMFTATVGDSNYKLSLVLIFQLFFSKLEFLFTE